MLIHSSYHSITIKKHQFISCLAHSNGEEATSRALHSELQYYH